VPLEEFLLRDDTARASGNFQKNLSATGPQQKESSPRTECVGPLIKDFRRNFQ
jgi:hypothetical protein